MVSPASASVGNLPRRELRRCLLGGPLDRLDLGADEHVAFGAAVRAAGAQAVERIDDEVERLEVDANRFDGGGGELFAVGGDGENRLALVHRLLGERELRRECGGVCGCLLRGRDGGGRRRRARCAAAAPGPVGGASPARRLLPVRGAWPARPRRHRRGGTRRGAGGGCRRAPGGGGGGGRSSAVRTACTPGIASARLASMLTHARVRTRAEHQLAEQHAVGAEVLGVLRLAGDFRHQVGRL